MHIKYRVTASVDAKFSKFHWRVSNIMQQHNRNSKFRRIPHKRRHQQERRKNMMYKHLRPILHLRLKEHRKSGIDVVSCFQGVECNDTGWDFAFWVGQVVGVWIPEPVVFGLDGPETDGNEENVADQFPG